MTRILCLRSRRTSRVVAALFGTLYVLFSSGAAFGALDLACAAKLLKPPVACETGPCCCGPEAHSKGTCCCRRDEAPVPADGTSFVQAASCGNPDAGEAGVMTRVSPHVSEVSVVHDSPVAAPAPEPAPSVVASPALPAEDKVPIARP